MQIWCKWNEKLKFTAQTDSHEIAMDARSPLGNDSALTPKQLLLASICGCTGMDVVSLLRKYKQSPDSLSINAQAELTSGAYPVIFQKVNLRFEFSGALQPEKLIEAVQLSQSKFCGVSAMIAKVCPIYYQIVLNGSEIHQGTAQFP